MRPFFLAFSFFPVAITPLYLAGVTTFKNAQI